MSSTSEENELRAWRRSSLRNEEYYQETARTWMLTGLADPIKRQAVPSAVPAAEGLIARAGRSVPAAGPRPGATRHRTLWLSWGIAAAGILAFAGAGAITWWRESAITGLGAAEFVTGESQMVTARLGDGSVVRLAPRSQLRVSGRHGQRDVWLDGRAFFAVAKQPNHPFTVHTRVGDAVALGTRFELRVENDELRLATVEGLVALSAGGVRVEVGRGEVSSVIRGAPPTVVKIDNVLPLLDWVGNFIAFQSTPLSEVGHELERRYGARVHIHEEALADRTVTAWFTDESLEEVVAIICRVVDAQCSIHDSIVDMRLRVRHPDEPNDSLRSRASAIP